jgi:hypothetical protein
VSFGGGVCRFVAESAGMGVRISVLAGALAAAVFVPFAADAQVSSPAPGASAVPLPSASGDPAVAERARAIFVMAQSGKIDRAEFTKSWDKISDAQIAKVGSWAASLGAVQDLALERTAPMHGETMYLYRVHCEKGDAEEIVSWAADGKISTVILRPAKG